MITEAIAFLTFPACVGLALVARPFVLAAFTNKSGANEWLGTVLPLQLIALYSTVRSISPIVPQLLTALGRTKIVMKWNMVAAVLLPLAFLLGTRWGTAGVAAAWIIVHPIFILRPMYRDALQAVGLRARDYLAALWPPFSCLIVMAVMVGGAQLALAGRLTPLVELIALIAVGAASYAGAVLLLQRQRVKSLIELVKRLRKS